jgi:hypothetical protein
VNDAARLMVRVFSVVFGAGGAVVVLLYLVLGAYFLYRRIESANSSNGTAAVLSKGSFIQTYDLSASPDFLPNAKLDCQTDGPWLKYANRVAVCSVLVDGRVAALISREDVKASLKTSE